eukprot:m.261094 g.261094  ORF g.261094 m.261094 type:complete len:80 (-) comp24223_c0_seq1:1969-2208(-)
MTSMPLHLSPRVRPAFARPAFVRLESQSQSPATTSQGQSTARAASQGQPAYGAGGQPQCVLFQPALPPPSINVRPAPQL